MATAPRIGGKLFRRLFGLALVATTLVSLLPGAPAPAAGERRLVRHSLRALNKLVTGDGHCSKKDAADGDIENGIELGYVFCDDGVPPSGGGSNGIPVPVKYHANARGNDWSGLPLPAGDEEAAKAAARDDLRPESGNRITLDVDISLPEKRAPKGGRPVIVFMHGCCGGNKTGWEAATIDAEREQWHHSNAWFAARGYVVVTYTARGFRNSSDRGSTGTTQLDSRRYEINDYQYLVGLLADHDAQRRAADKRPIFKINPREVAAVGGSYGGGFSWLALTDPTWRSPATRKRMRLGAVVTKYGWTDLVESLLPSGHYFDRDPTGTGTWIAPTSPKQAASRDPIGVEKQSIVAGLYATGNLMSSNHTTFPDYMHDAYARIQAGEPYDGDPNVEKIAADFIRDRSAYFQQSFWRRVANGLRVPVYSAATWTDPLFPTIEHVRFYNKLKAIAPDYPITMYLGDYQHFTQNKAKEWDDLCGDDHHICTIEDYGRSDGSLRLNKAPTRVREGINSRINRFLDYFLRGGGRKPAFDVAATTTICSSNATELYPQSEPGIEYRAPDWRALGPETKTFSWDVGKTTFSTAIDEHAPEADPVARDRTSEKCVITNGADPGPGVVQLVGDELVEPFTMMGIPTLRLDYGTAASDYWVEGRLFDRAPSGTMTLVSRGVCRVNKTAAEKIDCSVFDLSGNGWFFDKGHNVVLELTQADSPFLRRDNFPSSLEIRSANIELPTTVEALRNDFRS